MLSGQVRILNFDETVARQEELIRQYHPVVVDLKDLGPSVRLWSDRKNADKVLDRLNPELKNAVTFIGSGDFHHISSLLIGQFQEPLTVIVFDHHPDWDVLPPRLGCGSWVSEILRRPNVEKVVLLGISSDDISSYSVQTGNLDALRHDRVEIYPYSHGPTHTIFKKIPLDNVSVRVEEGVLRSRIDWQELKGRDLSAFFFDLLGRIETKNVYVSLDKDCLRSEWSLTNWEEGCFAFSEVELLLKLIRENLDIVGFDVVGDYSLPVMDGRIKTFLARLDHPRQFSAAGHDGSNIQAVNEKLNLGILCALSLHHQ